MDKRPRGEDDADASRAAATSPVRAPRAPYGRRKGGVVYEIRTTDNDIRLRVPLSLVAVKETDNKTEAWRYISERLEDPFPQGSAQFTNASTLYRDRTQLIIPDPFDPPYNRWVGAFHPKNGQRFMFILQVS